MNIVYVDLNHDDHFEDYSSINVKRYGGGRVFAAHAKEEFNKDGNNFYILADPKAFENVGDNERKDRCVPLDSKGRAALRNGTMLSLYVPFKLQVDLVVHHFTNHWINTFSKQVAWSVGYREQISEHAPYVILYNDYQIPQFRSPKTKTLKAKIGKPLLPFKEYEKEDYIFQCTRHNSVFGSIEVARFCKAEQIKGVFAGPIEPGYPLMDYIDNVNTFYLGVITEEKKRELNEKARLATFLHSWPTPFNLSAIETLGCGTPILATRQGFWPSLVTPKNGFFADQWGDLKYAWNHAPELRQEDCWKTAAEYSTEIMLKEFSTAFETVLNG